jgi:hypothetical protein
MTASAFTYGWMIGLVALCISFPNESNRVLNEMFAVAMIKYMNLRLFIASYLIWRRLRRDFRALGIELPPFKFVPLQDR